MLALLTLAVRGLPSPDVKESAYALLPKQDACADNTTYLDVEGHSCAQWAVVPCDLTTKEACGYSTADFDAVLENCPLACNTCDTSIGVHGDPIFKFGDKWMKFDLDPSYGLTPLLTWQEASTGSSSSNTYTIEASAKAHEHSKAEWLYAIALKVNGETTLLAKAGEPSSKGSPRHDRRAATRTMEVLLDGRQISSNEATSGKHHQVHVNVHTRRKHSIGRQLAETVHVQIKDGPLSKLELEITSSAASAYANPLNQAKYAHLNLRLAHMPTDSTGVLAELAGLRDMSSSTRSLVHERGEGDGPAAPGIVSAIRLRATGATTGAATCPFPDEMPSPFAPPLMPSTPPPSPLGPPDLPPPPFPPSPSHPPPSPAPPSPFPPPQPPPPSPPPPYPCPPAPSPPPPSPSPPPPALHPSPAPVPPPLAPPSTPPSTPSTLPGYKFYRITIPYFGMHGHASMRGMWCMDKFRYVDPDGNDLSYSGASFSASSESMGVNGGYTGNIRFCSSPGEQFPQWTQVEFEEPETISAYRLYTHDMPLDYYPTAWTLSGSNDGSTFVLIDTQSGVSWSNKEWKDFPTVTPLPPAPPPMAPTSLPTYKFYRITIPYFGMHGDASIRGMWCMGMFRYIGGNPPYNGSDISYYRASFSASTESMGVNAGYSRNRRFCSSPGEQFPQWTQVEFEEPETISAYRLYSDDMPVGYYPTAWTLSGSNDGSTFVLIDTQSGVSWSNGEWKDFPTVTPLPPAPPPMAPTSLPTYKFYRITIPYHDGPQGMWCMGMFRYIGGNPPYNGSDISYYRASFSASTESMGVNAGYSRNRRFCSSPGEQFPQWTQVEFEEPETISAYRLYSDDMPVGYYPTAWTLSGSNDGSTFVLIDTQSGVSWLKGEWKDFPVS